MQDHTDTSGDEELADEPELSSLTAKRAMSLMLGSFLSSAFLHALIEAVRARVMNGFWPAWLWPPLDGAAGFLLMAKALGEMVLGALPFGVFGGVITTLAILSRRRPQTVLGTALFWGTFFLVLALIGLAISCFLAENPGLGTLEGRHWIISLSLPIAGASYGALLALFARLLEPFLPPWRRESK